MLETSGGSVALTVPRALGAELDARTSGGRVSVDVPVAARVRGRSEVRGPVNGGGPLLRLRTSGGSVSVHSR